MFWVALPLWLAGSHGGPLCAPRDERPADRGHFALSIGRFALADLETDGFDELTGEWRFPRTRWGLQPIAGLTLIEGGASYAYAGLRYELDLGADFLLAPSFAAGIYDDDNSFDLGGPVNFRSALELSWRATDAITLGLTFYHLSNGRLYEENDGSESLVLTVGLDLFELFEQ